MTLPEAAARYGLNADSLRQAAYKGKLGAVRQGRDWHVSQIVIEDYIARKAKTTKEAENDKDTD